MKRAPERFATCLQQIARSKYCIDRTFLTAGRASCSKAAPGYSVGRTFLTAGRAPCSKAAPGRAALLGALALLASCAAVPGMEMALNSMAGPAAGMFLKLGPAVVGLTPNNQGWLPLNSMYWGGSTPYQQAYPAGAYPQQTYQQGAYPTYPQQQPYQPYPQDEAGQAYGAQTYPQDEAGQAYGAQTYPQDTTGQAYGAQTYPQVATGGAVPAGAGLASLSTNDPAAAAALAQACASGQPLGTVTVRQVQADGTYKDIQLSGVNLACGGPSAGGEAGTALKPGEEVLMTFSDTKIVNMGKMAGQEAGRR